MHAPPATASSATAAASAAGAASAAESTDASAGVGAAGTASAPRAKPPTHTPAAAAHGRKLNVRRFFTRNLQRERGKHSTFRETELPGC
ncbi:MAG: hypothetical protein EBU31_13410 [Proteobacteria bacterium]|nr:hypothetical protein [Pseudomonadota bacterium]